MADRQISVSALIRRLEQKGEAKAVKLVQSGGSYEDFLIGTGKFRENRALIQYLEELIDKDPRPVERGNAASNEMDDLDPDEEDEDEEAETPPPVARRSKPRGWGS